MTCQVGDITFCQAREYGLGCRGISTSWDSVEAKESSLEDGFVSLTLLWNGVEVSLGLSHV